MSLPKQVRTPKVIELDCHKWWRIIGITLWAFASFGIYIGEYNMVQWSIQDKFSICLGDQVFSGKYDSNGYGMMRCGSWSIWSPLDIIGMIIGTGATLFNTIGIWMAINEHFRIVQVKCRTRSY